MASADTNVLVRILVEDDATQLRRAESFLKRNGPLWISSVVLAEGCWVLAGTYGWRKAEILTALRGLQESADFVLQSSSAVRSAIALFERTNADFADCLALELARAEGQLPMGTFDRAAGKLSGAAELH